VLIVKGERNKTAFYEKCEKDDKLKGGEKGIAHGVINTAIELCSWKTEITKRIAYSKIEKGLLYIEINKTKGEEQTVKIEN